MKYAPRPIRNCICLVILASIVIGLTGCSINARQFAWSAYENRDPSVDQWERLDPSTDRTLLLATYASTHYTRSNQLASDAELISGDTPVLLAWIEFSKTDQLIPLYRYVIQPLKAITAQELLAQGKYISNATPRINNLPARTPAKVTNGAVVTDWQYCYDCFTTMPLDELNPASIAYLREQVQKTMASRPLDRLIFINTPKEAQYLKSRPSVTVYTGPEAMQEQSLLAEQVSGLTSDVANAKRYDELYRQFTEVEYKPLTFAYQAAKAGCPTNRANTREISGDRRSIANTVIRVNTHYIECNSKVLESYDPAPLEAKYDYLSTREEMLWERSSKTERHQVRRPERTIDNVIGTINDAIEGLESAYDNLELADRLDARNRDLEVFGQQQWNNTLNSIQSRNESIKAQQQQIQKIIRNTQRERHTTPEKKQYDPTSPRPGPSRADATPRTDTASTGDATSVVVAAPAEEKPAQAEEKPNRYVGAGRDYPFTGTSGQFFNRELAVDLAQTHLMNQASEFCGGGLKTEIRWAAQSYCKPSASEEGNFKCTIDGMVNCYENFCDEPYCGTER
ncbi:hypothetical protein [uncultured Halopseudomonas sp.]|uniref:hypothetical protein n=1 Tax=uncultured Halopseudomonas sp. TaxID=2901193 RepID=UPI0030EE2E0C